MLHLLAPCLSIAAAMISGKYCAILLLTSAQFNSGYDVASDELSRCQNTLTDAIVLEAYRKKIKCEKINQMQNYYYLLKCAYIIVHTL